MVRLWKTLLLTELLLFSLMPSFGACTAVAFSTVLYAEIDLTTESLPSGTELTRPLESSTGSSETLGDQTGVSRVTLGFLRPHRPRIMVCAESTSRTVTPLRTKLVK